MLHKKTNNTIIIGLLDGLRESVSLALASGMFGVVFGALAHIQGMGAILSIWASLTMYAGAAQVVYLKIWHSSFITLVMTLWVVCLRYFLMGFSLRLYWNNLPKFIVYPALFLLMDENWALTLSKAKTHRSNDRFLLAYFIGAGLLSYTFWCLGTFIGSYLTHYAMRFEQLGLEFAFTALFLGLLVGNWRGKRDLCPWIAAFISSIFANWALPGSWYIIIGGLLGSLVGLFYETFSQ